MKKKFVYNEKEQKTRNRWRIACLVYFFISLFGTHSMLGNMLHPELRNGFPVFILITFFGYLLLYYFSYVRGGYYLLMWNLFSPLLTLVRHKDKLKDFSQINDSTEALILIVWTVAVNFWWYYASIKLINLNSEKKRLAKEEKKEELLSSSKQSGAPHEEIG